MKYRPLSCESVTRDFLFYYKEVNAMKITLKDGSVKEYQQPMAIIDIARDLSEGLARVACVRC